MCSKNSIHTRIQGKYRLSIMTFFVPSSLLPAFVMIMEITLIHLPMIKITAVVKLMTL